MSIDNAISFDIDAKSGGYSVHLPVATVIGNAGLGPSFDVGFRYSSELKTWVPNVTYGRGICRKASEDITLCLSSGETVHVNTSIQLPGMKIIMVQGGIAIHHKNGVTEYLEARVIQGSIDGYEGEDAFEVLYEPVKLVSPIGHVLFFTWQKAPVGSGSNLMLSEIKDNKRTIFTQVYDSEKRTLELSSFFGVDKQRLCVIAMGDLSEEAREEYWPEGCETWLTNFAFEKAVFYGDEGGAIEFVYNDSYYAGLTGIKTSGSEKSITLERESNPKIASHTLSFNDLLPTRTTTYAYEDAEDGNSVSTTTTTQGNAVTTSIKYFDKQGQLYKELLTEDGVTIEILQGVFFVKTWGAFIGYTKKSPPGVDANEQNVAFWVLDLDGNLICLLQNGIFTQRTYYKSYTMSVEARNAVSVVDESLFAWFTVLIGLNRGTSYGIRYDIEGMKLPAAPPSATERFNLPPIKEIGCPANPNFFNTYLESERVYKWSGGKLVDLSLTFYGYTRLAIKGDSPNLVKEMDAVLPSVKLTILAAECEDQAVFRKEAQTFNQGEIKALYGDWVDNGINKFTTAQAVKGLSQSVSSTTMTGFVAAIVEPLEIKLKAWKDCSMTLETTEYYNDVKDQSHGRVKQTTFCILDKAGKEVPDSKQVTDFAYHMEQNKLTKTITFNDHDSSTRAQSQEITSINTGLVLGTIGSLKEQTEFAYDEQSRLIKETKTFPGTTAAENVTLETHYAYLELDNKGIAVDCTLPSGERQSSAYDAFGRPTASYLYSEAKQSWLPLVTIDYGPDGLTQTNIEYDYDAQDNELCRIESIRKIERTKEWDQQSLVLGNIVRYERYLHDTRQLRVWQTLDDQQTDATLTTYNTDGSIARVQTLAADESVLLETHFEYDLRGCLSKRTSTGQPDMMYEYDGFSRITRITCDGITTVNEYPANLLAETAVKAKVQAQGSDTSYELGGLTLDRLGRVKKSTIGGRSLDYSYAGSSRWGLHRLPAPNVKAPWVIEAGQTLSMTMISHHPYRVKGDF